MLTLKRKILLLILVGYVVTVLMAFGALTLIAKHLMTRLGSGYAAKYSLANKALVQDPINHDLVLVRQWAESQSLRRWMAHENDLNHKQHALQHLDRYRQNLTEHNWFLVVNSSLHYYSNDQRNQFEGKELVYTLAPTNTQDSWYFSSIKNVKQVALNVNYDRGLDVRKVWINAIIRDEDNHPLGMTGTGFDLSRFLSAFIDRNEPGVQHILMDQRLAIQAHRNRSLIDLNTIATPETNRSTIARILTRPDDLAHLREAMEELRNGSQAETLSVTVDHEQQWLGISYIPELDWYVLTLLDLAEIIGKRIFFMIGLLVILTTLILTGLALVIMNKLALKPLVDITRATRTLSQGTYSPFTPSDREDEIGTLSRAFATMNERIHENTLTLESRIGERTAELDKANRTLQNNLNELKEAHSKVRVLSGMLPVCCACNKIRDEKDHWKTLDVYVQEHTDAQYSHGICPDCMSKLYPGITLPEANHSP